MDRSNAWAAPLGAWKTCESTCRSAKWSSDNIFEKGQNLDQNLDQWMFSKIYTTAFGSCGHVSGAPDADSAQQAVSLAACNAKHCPTSSSWSETEKILWWGDSCLNSISSNFVVKSFEPVHAVQNPTPVMFLPSQETVAKICGKSCSGKNGQKHFRYHAFIWFICIQSLHGLDVGKWCLEHRGTSGPRRANSSTQSRCDSWQWAMGNILIISDVRGSLHDIWHSPDSPDAPNAKHRSKSSWARRVESLDWFLVEIFDWNMGGI